MSTFSPNSDSIASGSAAAGAVAAPAGPSRQPSPAEQARRRAGLNIFANVGGYALNVVVAFFIWPLQVHQLGNDAYGLWALLQQLISYATLLDFGIRIAAMRNIARVQALRDEEETSRLISTSFFMMLLPALFILVCGGWASLWLPHRLGLGPELIWPARAAILLTAVTVALAAPGSIFNACVAAVSRYDLLGARNACVQIARGLLLWYFLTHGYGLVAVAAIFLVTEQLGQGLDLLFSLRQIRGFHLRWRKFDRATVRRMAHFGAYAFLISVAVRLVYWSDNVVVGFLAGPAAVTFYSVAGSLVQYLRDGITNVTSIFGPLTAQLDAMGEHDGLRRIYVSGSKWGVICMMPGVIFLLFDGNAFLRLWMGPEMAQRATLPLIFLALSALTMPIAAMYSHVLYATARHQLNGWMAMVEAALNLALSIVLIRRMGISGVALGTLLPAFLLQIVVLPTYTVRLLQLSIWRYQWEALIRPLVAGLPVAGLAAWAARGGWGRNWIELITAGIILTSLYGVTAWYVALARTERRQILQWVGAKLAGWRSVPRSASEVQEQQAG